MVQRLPRRVGLGQAKRLMFTAQPVSAAEAHAIGLVDVLVEDEQFETAVAQLGTAILENSWFTNRETKRMIRATDGMSLHDALVYATQNYPGVAPDSRERVARFSGKPGR